MAQEAFRANLESAAGETARAYLARRGVTPETIAQFGLGYASAPAALVRMFGKRNFPSAQMEQSGWWASATTAVSTTASAPPDVSIHNESGKVIGFGGRALAADDTPKYLNSPETAIYKKSQVLYNLHRAKETIRKQDRVILWKATWMRSGSRRRASPTWWRAAARR